ncbi:Fe-only nitrogenase accessory AnfO family protein [Fundidesulfovibrio putealis]|uniref:Fe-only nitrogenase accessory AnfO family protein n=1 Tax=Fundidesulfovibrio putealis TaxID=270496 RepID=UPI000489AE32|nr:Fe-only nitrogenase accessory AnfO family protein [Fundidesulfovibrio putealis]
MMEIAAHMDMVDSAPHDAASFHVIVYRYQEQAWRPAREMTLDLGLRPGVGEICGMAAALRLFLGTCTTLLTRKLPPVLARALHKRGMTVWECAADPELLLDYAWEQAELEKDIQGQPGRVCAAPRNLGDGHYIVSLQGCQGKATGPSSKQVLKSFLETTPFKSLEVYCSHMPPWMRAQCQNGRFTATRNRSMPESCASSSAIPLRTHENKEFAYVPELHQKSPPPVLLPGGAAGLHDHSGPGQVR